MYIPKHFAERRLEVLHRLVRPYPFGTLEGHLARANPRWRRFLPEVEALAIFQGPDGYITPLWYATKQVTGEVVPTWNYVVVHAYGTLRVVEDEAWLRRHVEQLTDQQERGQDEPWSVADAPADYIARLLEGIVGVEISLSRSEGKWELSQNRPLEDRQGVIHGLRAGGEARAGSPRGLHDRVRLTPRGTGRWPRGKGVAPCRRCASASSGFPTTAPPRWAVRAPATGPGRCARR